MEHVVLATAGHIDHGKTELTRALTGIDTDRLPEEKARGITIDLGFAHTLLAGRRVAVIDVPGHERFVRNMLAGVGGIDLALLVVAADESVMPQTREHLAILELLAVPAGVVALTKCDLADAEVRELAALEVRELVRGTFLEDAAVVPVSARTGEGIEALRAALGEAVGKVRPHDASGPLRIEVDRAFSVKGFGSVATGTVWTGRIAVGDEVEVLPGRCLAKVRSLEVHGEPASEVPAGSRAAVNLPSVELAVLARGSQIVTPRWFAPASLLDVRLRLLAAAARPVRDLDRVHVHLGTSEFLARVRLLDPETALEPGREGHAQLRAERAVLAWPGDRFIIRSYSPVTTLGGGVVVDLPPEKHRGPGGLRAAGLRLLEGAAPRARIEQLVASAGERGLTIAELAARTGRLPDAIEAAIAASGTPGGGTPGPGPQGGIGIVRLAGSPPRLVAAGAWHGLGERALSVLADYHRREPLREGMSREELAARVAPGDPATARRRIDGLASEGRLRLIGDLVARAEHAVRMTDDERASLARLEERFRSAGLNPPAPKEALAGLGERGDRLLAVLARDGRLVAVPGGLYFHAQAITELKERLRASAGDGSAVTVGRFKELTGTSRKFAIPLLEHLDAVKFTRRQGDERFVVAGR